MLLDFIISAYASLSVKIHIILFTTANKTVSLTSFQLIRTRSCDGYPYLSSIIARVRDHSLDTASPRSFQDHIVSLFPPQAWPNSKNHRISHISKRRWNLSFTERFSRKSFDYALCVHPRRWRFKFSREERDTIRGSFRQAKRQYRETQAADSQQARRVSK